MSVTAHRTSISDYVLCICIDPCVSVCVWITEKKWVGKRRLTTWRRFLVFSKPRKWNQQWRGCDVISRRSFLTAAPRLPRLFCHFLFVCLYFHLSLYLSLCVCISPCLYLLLSLMLHCRGVGVCWLISFFFFSFFMNGLPCLLSDKAIFVNADDEHIQCDHTNFLCFNLPYSDWLRPSSQWQRFWGSCEYVRVSKRMHIFTWAKALRGLRGLLFRYNW